MKSTSGGKRRTSKGQTEAGSRRAGSPASKVRAPRARPAKARGKAKASAAAKAPPRAAPSRSAPSRSAPRRADFGAPIDGFFAKQPPALRAILDALRALVEEAAPDATAAIKWGMPFFALEGEMMCALGAHRSHVNLVLSGPPDAFADPEGRLEGGGTKGRHLKLRTLEDLPRQAVRGWLRTAAALARGK